MLSTARSDPRPASATTPDDSRDLRLARLRSAALGTILLALAAAIGVSLAVAPAGPWFQAADEAWNELMVRHRSPWLVDLARVLAVVGSPWVSIPARVAVSVLLAARRRWLQLAVFVTAVVVSQSVVSLVKWAEGRSRPPNGLVRAYGASFPSGHASVAAVTALGVVIALVPRSERRWHWIVGATAFATLMSWSRTYLSVHWASDTIAGAAFGIAVALLTEAAFEIATDRRRTVRTDAPAGPRSG